MNCSHLHEDLERIICADSFDFLSKSITIKTLCLGTTFHIIMLVFYKAFAKKSILQQYTKERDSRHQMNSH